MSADLKEVRKLAMLISGTKIFQTEENAKGPGYAWHVSGFSDFMERVCKGKHARVSRLGGKMGSRM